MHARTLWNFVIIYSTIFHPTFDQSSSILVAYKKPVLYSVDLVRENHFPTQLFKIFKMNNTVPYVVP